MRFFIEDDAFDDAFFGDCDALGDCDGVADYLQDLSSFYRSAEGFCRPLRYLDLAYVQPYLDAPTRSDMVETLIDIHEMIQLRDEALFLAVYVLDSYLSVRTVEPIDLSAVVLAAMLIASKYDDVCSPSAYQYHLISYQYHRICPKRRILKMEKDILDHLGWNLSVPTPYVFLIALLRASGHLHDDDRMKNMAFFFAHLALTQYHLMVSFPPSLLAASSVYAARCTLDEKPLWTEALFQESGYSEGMILDYAQCLLQLHLAATRGRHHFKFLYKSKRYSDLSLSAVAMQPPAAAIETVARAVCGLMNRVFGFLERKISSNLNHSYYKV